MERRSVCFVCGHTVKAFSLQNTEFVPGLAESNIGGNLIRMQKQQYNEIGRKDDEEDGTDVFELPFPEIMNHLGTIPEDDLGMDILGGDSA